MNTDDTFKVLKNKIIRVLNKQAGHEKHNNSTIRLWKSNPSYCKPEYVYQFLRNHKIGGPETEFETF